MKNRRRSDPVSVEYGTRNAWLKNHDRRLFVATLVYFKHSINIDNQEYA